MKTKMKTKKYDMEFAIAILLCLLLALVISALITSHGHAAPQAVPYIPDNGIKYGIVTVYDPGNPYYKAPGMLTLKDANTQTIYDVPMNYDCYGPGQGYGIFHSGLPKFSGIQVIQKIMLSDGREVYTNNQDIFGSELFQLHLPLIK